MRKGIAVAADKLVADSLKKGKKGASVDFKVGVVSLQAPGDPGDKRNTLKPRHAEVGGATSS